MIATGIEGDSERDFEKIMWYYLRIPIRTFFFRACAGISSRKHCRLINVKEERSGVYFSIST